jgi:hypothetical protein
MLIAQRMVMSANGISHAANRRTIPMAPPVAPVIPLLAWPRHLPYVQRVDLHAHGLMIMPRAQQSDRPAQRRCQR